MKLGGLTTLTDTSIGAMYDLCLFKVEFEMFPTEHSCSVLGPNKEQNNKLKSVIFILEFDTF